MNRYFSLSSLLLLWFILSDLNAQPVLTQMVHQPEIADLNPIHYIDSTGIVAGPSGASVTWDFTGVVYSGEADTFMYQTPPSSWNWAFPAANIAGRHYPPSSGLPTWEHYQTFADSTLFWGWGMDYVSDLGPSLYTNPRKEIEYPFTYLSSFTDSIEGEYHGFIVLTFAGNYHVTADAYGTLMLPGTTYSNVLRVRSEEIITGSSGSTYVLKYEYFEDSTRYPILTIAWTSGGDKEVFTSGKYVATGVYNNALLSNWKIFPNPADDYLWLELSFAQKTSLDLSIIDLQGREVFQKYEEKCPSGVHQVRIPVEKLSEGWYWVRLNGEVLKLWIN